YLLQLPAPPTLPPFPYTTLFRSLGGGAGLAACSDVAIAAPDAVFGFSEVKLGIIPAVISPFVLPKIGQHARRYFLTGERFDAQRSEEHTSELQSLRQLVCRLLPE